MYPRKFGKVPIDKTVHRAVAGIIMDGKTQMALKNKLEARAVTTPKNEKGIIVQD